MYSNLTYGGKIGVEKTVPTFEKGGHRIERFNHELWGYVVPDGPAYCHWGGRRQAKHLAELLRPQADDRILELCCGQGGLLQYLQPATGYGLDISLPALTKARQLAPLAKRVCADAYALPFADRVFTKIAAQDADAWLEPQKTDLMREIARVTASRGLFIWQTYVETAKLTKQERAKTVALLQQAGLTHTELPHQELLPQLISTAGFRVLEQRSLHALYETDNTRMWERFCQNRPALLKRFTSDRVAAIGALLEWEQYLFRRGRWSGVLLISRKEE